MAKKNKEEEVSLETEKLTHQKAIEEIHAANKAFSQEKVDFDIKEKSIDEEKERTKTVVDSLEVVDSKLNKSAKDLTKVVNAFVNEKLDTPAVVNKLAATDITLKVSQKDLVESLSRTGSVTEDAKVDFVSDNLIRNPDDSINWRKNIKPEYLVFNKDYKDSIEKQYGKPMGELTVEEVDDKYLLILLAGIKEVAKLRGFYSVKYPLVHAEPSFVSVYCEIEWRRFLNGEKVEEGFTQGDGADATPQNTEGFSKNFLTAIAFNRAFVRAVRTSLNIHIVGKDEVGPAVRVDQASGEKEINPLTPKGSLQAKLNKLGKTVQDIGKYWAKNKADESALKWESLDDVDTTTIFDILGELKMLEERRKAGKKE